MPDNTVTLRLSGDVTLAKFALAVDRFNALIQALTGPSNVEWIIADLQPGSASTTAEGRGDMQTVGSVVGSYEDVGGALEKGRPLLSYPKPVIESAFAIRNLIGNGVDSAIFETANRTAIIRSVPTGTEEQPPTATPVVGTSRAFSPAYGAVSGRVETIARRGTLRFVLYDLLHDKAVSCYLADGYEDIMRGVWGRLATVEGLVTRDPLSGRPIAIRRITKVTPRPERAGSYKDARGASPYSEMLPEDMIRRVRNGW